jgi:hypothetical protein
MCYAVQLAFDSADDPVYADGWQGRVVNAAGVAVTPTGDNGGFGFGEWDFTSLLTWQGMRYDYANTNFHAIDDGLQSGTHYSNPHNSIGRAWALGSAPNSGGPPRAGRGFALGIGETLKVVFDNPTRQLFWKGYQINLHGGTGGVDGNMCYGGVECVAGSGAVPKAGLTTFENNTFGEWGLHDAVDTNIGVYDSDTAASGAEFTVERTGTETYIAKLVSVGGADFGPVERTFDNAGAEVDWIEFTFYNGTTDETPTLAEFATDLYIRSMEIFATAPPGVPGDYNNNGTVDAADYVLWRKHLDTGFQLQNEVAGVTPSTVTEADYDAWLARFGNTPGAGAGDLVAGAAVPEPGTFAYFVGLMAGAFIRRRYNEVS